MPGKWRAYQLHAFYSEHIRKLRILIQQLVKYERLLLTPRRAEILKKEANLVRTLFLLYYRQRRSEGVTHEANGATDFLWRQPPFNNLHWLLWLCPQECVACRISRLSGYASYYRVFKEGLGAKPPKNPICPPRGKKTIPLFYKQSLVDRLR